MYAFSSPRFQEQLQRAATSTTVSLVNKGRFGELTVPLPPIPEQRGIVEAIDEQFSRLEAAEESLRRARSRLGILRKATVNQAVPTEGQERALGEALGKTSLFVDGDWIETKDQDPQGEVRLIQLADIGEGVFRNRSSRFLTSATASRLKCTYLEPHDLLVARMPDPLGRCCEFPGVGMPSITAVDVCIIRINETSLDSRWLMHALNATRTRRQIAALESGTTRRRISRKNLATVKLTIPDHSTQVTLAEKVDKDLSVVEAMNREANAATTRIGQIRNRVLGDALAGRLVRQNYSKEQVVGAGERLSV